MRPGSVSLLVHVGGLSVALVHEIEHLLQIP